MILTAENLELRGCERKVSAKTNQPYLVFFLEEASGNPVRFVCRNTDALTEELKKGVICRGVFEYNQFGNLNLVNLFPMGGK